MPKTQVPAMDMFVNAFLNQARDHAILFFDTEEIVVWASPGAENILHVPPGSLVGRCTSDFFVPEDVEMGIPAHEFAIARSRGSSEDDRWMLRPDGSRFWASGVSYALRNAKGELCGYGKIFQNRTDWREQITALRNEAVEAGKEIERKSQIVSTFGHELRGPLGPLMNAASLLREGTRVDYPIQLIERQVHFIGRLVDDLMEATAAHVGKVRLRLERLVLQDVLERTADAVRARIHQSGQHLDVLLPSGSVVIEGDAVRLEQVFANLLTNASKYTPPGGRIWLKLTVEGNEAVVRVEDNGIGIEPAMLDHIFDLFAQVHAPREPGEGVGIGLSLVKDLVKLHWGSVQANSDGVGKGSDFIVRLPILRAVAE